MFRLVIMKYLNLFNLDIVELNMSLKILFVDEESITVSMVNWPGEQLRAAKDISRGEKQILRNLKP